MKPEEFVKAIEASRELVKSGKYNECPCPNAQCEWHGKCFECVMIHRVKGKHVPECLQPIFRQAVADLAKKVELSVVDARPTKECWDRLQKVSPPKKKR